MPPAVTDADVQFELLEFEQVEAAPGTVLLRVACRPGSDVVTDNLALVIEDNGVKHRHEQLPTLPGPPGLVRAAFSAPLENVGEGASYSLALPDGQLVRLPAPVRRRASSELGGRRQLPQRRRDDAGWRRRRGPVTSIQDVADAHRDWRSRPSAAPNRGGWRSPSSSGGCRASASAAPPPSRTWRSCAASVTRPDPSAPRR